MNKVCETHQLTFSHEPTDKDLTHIIQGLPGYESDKLIYINATNGGRNSLVYLTDNPDNHGNVSVASKLISLCNATCVSKLGNGRRKEALYDLLLVQTLEVFRSNTREVEVLARRAHNIWPKAALCNRDFKKETRRMLKGGKTVKAKRRKTGDNTAVNTKKMKTELETGTVNLEEEIVELELPVIEVDHTFIFDYLRKEVREGRLSVPYIVKELNKKETPEADISED